MKLTIGMPAYNEEVAIKDVIGQALAVLDRMQTKGEVLILDDCSQDRTREIVRGIQDPRVRLLKNETNLGVCGFERKLVLEARGEWLFMGSSDGETDYDDVPRFLERAEKEKLHAIFGYREIKNYTRYRLVISFLYNFLVFLFFGARFRDAGWVKLFHQKTFATIPLYSRSAFISAERLLAARKLGVRYAEMPSRHLPRLAGRGRGAQWRWVAASCLDLLRTRARFVRFQTFYGKDR